MNSIVRGSRRLRAAAVAGALAVTTLSFAGTAMAEGNPTIMVGSNGDDTIMLPDACADHTDQFRFRFYYHAGYQGAWINVGHPIADMTSIPIGGGNSYPALTFCSNGDGGGQRVANNSASAYNWFDHYGATVYYSKNFSGGFDRILPNSGMNLDATKNNNRSINFYSY
ncbi:hypothetical protein [Kitasatospora sp. NBC_01302]|uniref:hypothetical protein n=1 Tax=Kitasatospora sp. NBC_01302 TaxID=2903575 RepID=UPI002E14B0EA|nr:hypothetical protein OG294_19045 [Kitasatospora sp. NBC_01302]